MKNSVIKKFCIFTLVLCLICGNAFIYAEADSSELVPPAEVLSKYVDVEELRAYLFNGFKECTDERIELARFNIPNADAEKQALKNFIWREMPECFHVDKLKISNNGAIITAIRSNGYKYIESKEQYLSMLAEIEAKAAVLLDGIIGNDSLSEAEKALLIHDRLAVNCNYNNDTNVAERYTAYGALVRGVAVCDGYSRAYSYLLRRVGIKSINCSSDKLFHSWNLVMIDGNYYHVDVTWDDPMCLDNSTSFEGYVQHNYFLLSDKAIKDNKHNATDYYNTLSPDTKYDGYFWKCSEAEFQLVGDQIYYFDTENAQLMRLNDDRVSGTALWSVPDRWWAPDRTYYWEGNYTRLASDGRSLFFSNPESVFIYSVSSSAAKVLFRPELKDGNVIYGLTYSDGNIIVDANDRPTGSNARLQKLTYAYTPEEDTENPPERISAVLETTTDIQNYQIVTATVTSDTGISGYYFGTNTEYTADDIEKSTEAKVTFRVREAGTYYFTAFDGAGESSETVSLTFCVIILHLRGGSAATSKILTEKNNKFILPEPEKEGAAFAGWVDSADGKNGVLCYEISDPPLTSEVYATWIAISEPEDPGDPTIAGSVTVGGNTSVTVTLIGENGEAIDAAVSENGEFKFDESKGAAFVEITAPGYVGRIYRAADFAGAGGEIKLDMLGDMDRDEELNNKDVTVLFRDLSKSDEGYDDVADVNGDSANDNKDVVFLFRCLSDPTMSLITHSRLMY